MGRQAGLKTLHSWGVGYEEPPDRTQSVKADVEVSVKGQKLLLWQHSCLLPSFQSSQLDFGMETSPQTHPSPRHRQWVKGHRIQWLTPWKHTWPQAALRCAAAPDCTGRALHPQPPDPPKLEAHTTKALRTSCQCHTASSLLPSFLQPAMVHELPLAFCTSMHCPHTSLYMQPLETSSSGEK